MTRAMRRTPLDQSDALTCCSAVLLLRVDPGTALADKDIVTRLDGLLSAVSLELKADHESVPPSIRCAAAQLADHIVRRLSFPVRSGFAGTDESVTHLDRGAHPATGIPFSRSIRLGRMG